MQLIDFLPSTITIYFVERTDALQSSGWPDSYLHKYLLPTVQYTSGPWVTCTNCSNVPPSNTTQHNFIYRLFFLTYNIRGSYCLVNQNERLLGGIRRTSYSVGKYTFSALKININFSFWKYCKGIFVCNLKHLQYSIR